MVIFELQSFHKNVQIQRPSYGRIRVARYWPIAREMDDFLRQTWQTKLFHWYASHRLCMYTIWTAGKSIYESVNIHEMLGNQFNVCKSTGEQTNIQNLKLWTNRTYSIHVSYECLYTFEQQFNESISLWRFKRLKCLSTQKGFLFFFPLIIVQQFAIHHS